LHHSLLAVEFNMTFKAGTNSPVWREKPADFCHSLTSMTDTSIASRKQQHIHSIRKQKEKVTAP